MKLELCAELSASHNGSLDRALEIVEAAANAGATHFKLQTWSPGRMCVDRRYTVKRGPWRGRPLAEMYEQAWTPWDWHPVIFDYARVKKLTPFSAAFDRESVDFLEVLGVDRHKVASFEATDLPLIRYMASKGKPILLSTGMASRQEVAAAVEACNGLAIPLACTSTYPADPAAARIADFADCWAMWGLSDHTLGIGTAVAAATLGACYIEKHLTLDRGDGGLDCGFSMEPKEFKAMADACKQAVAATGVSRGNPKESTELRRSLWVIMDTPAGCPLRLYQNVDTARPELGLPPSTDLTGKVAARPLRAGTPLTKDDIHDPRPT